MAQQQRGAQQQIPTPDAVGDMYDQFSELCLEMFAGCIHFGYFQVPPPASSYTDESIEAATDRMTSLVADQLALPTTTTTTTNTTTTTTGGGGPRILDVGCGTGKPARQVASLTGAHVVGISISQRQIELAAAPQQQQQQQPQQSSSIGGKGNGGGSRSGVITAAPVREEVSFQYADAMKDLPFPAGSFAGAYAIESLFHMGDKGAALAQVSRALRPGGRLVVADFFVDPAVGDDDLAPEHVAAFCHLTQSSGLNTVDEWRGLVEGAGFRVVEVRDIRRNVRRNYRVMAETLRQKALYAPEVAKGGLEAGAAVMENVSGSNKIGYLLLTAERV
ncbi:methyltransferase domain-containing protein [Purpureocillium lavendulum]|uniref:Methyltransferase domain-containing protein n=1 Tax=Purpureocillium lavendulum TaxID=1247861 RepID=A0AB34FUB5_9HYPO|nr:methyltransferase domain-containing protein [Purpureocillium lavendulum]